MALFCAKNGQLQTLKGIYQNIRIEREVHVNFNGGMPFKSYASDVKYTRDIDRRFKSNRTPVNKSTNNQDFPVWCWTELNEDETETLYIGCKHFYTGESKLFVHYNNTNSGSSGLFRYFKGTNLDFCKEWDATYITALYCSFKDTKITDFSGIQDWNMPNLISMQEMASQLPNSRDFRPFLKWTIGHKAPTTYSMYYGNQRTYNDWSPMCSNYFWKLANNVDATMSYLPYCYYLDMTNWDLTEWNLGEHNLFLHGAGTLKIKTPILPLTVKPMKLPYTYYDMDTEQAYTEIPLNLDRQLTLYKNKSDFGK